MIEIAIFIALAIIAFCIYLARRPAPGLDEEFNTLRSEFMTPLASDEVAGRLSGGFGHKAKLVTRQGDVFLFEQGPVPTMLGAFFKVTLEPQADGGTKIVTEMRPRAHEVGGSVRRSHAQFISTIEAALA